MDLHEWKKSWQNQEFSQPYGSLNEDSLHAIIKRTNRQKNSNMQYFWASFIFQMIVYALFAHVGIKYWSDTPLLVGSIIGIVLYLPFTVLLMQKFKRLAALRLDDASIAAVPLKDYVSKHYRLIKGFFRFKVIYEMVLIPTSAAIFVWMFFRIYFPGGALSYPIASLILFIVVIAACAAAILAENLRNFIKPMRELEKTLLQMEEPAGIE